MISYTKRRLRVIISFLFVLSYCIIVLCPVQAADIERIKIDENAPQKVVLIVGKSTLIETPMNIKRVALASPEYADVQIVSPRQLYLIGNSAGLTTLTLWGIDGKVSHMLDIEVVPDVTCLKEKIYEMFPNEKNIKVTSSHDALVLTGTVSNTSNLTQVLALAQAYVRDKDGKSKVMNMLEVGGVQQVMLEVRVAEMQRTLMKRLGVNFNYISNGGNTFGITALNSLASIPATLPPSPSIASGNVSAIFRFLGGGATWTTFIDALQENGLTKLLAEPTLITTSGRAANFLAGGEFPIPVPQSGVGAGSTITIDYKTYGVGLNFTPTVLSNEKISMVVSPEVSELDYTNALSISGYVVPALTTRRASTVIELADGQSFAIAGLLQSQVIEDVKKYPVLGDIPILGALFRSSSFQKNESELVIIVTPHLVKPLDMAKQTLPTDQFVEPNDFEFYLLGSTEGLGEPSQSSRSAVPPKSDKTGFEGDFGHIVPK
jgi:pilus assembly protein CpaC